MPLTQAELDELVQEDLTIDLLTLLGHMERENQKKMGIANRSLHVQISSTMGAVPSDLPWPHTTRLP